MRRASIAGGLAAIAALAVLPGCDSDAAEVRVEPPPSVVAIVEATLDTEGLEVDHQYVAVDDRDAVVIDTTTRYDTQLQRAYQTGEGVIAAETDRSSLELSDLGENWFVDGRAYTREPGETSARLSSGDLASMVIGESSGASETVVATELAVLLAGWPGTEVSNSALVEGVPAYRSRVERDDGDAIEVWVDATGRLLRVESRKERAPYLVLESTYHYLAGPPEIPALPTLTDG